MLPQDEEGLLAMTLKSLKFDRMTLLRLTLIDNVYEVISQNEGYTFTSESEFLFEMTQNMAEVDVKQLPGFLNHYIVGMPVGYSKNVGRDTITGAAQGELLNSLVQCRLRMVMIF